MAFMKGASGVEDKRECSQGQRHGGSFLVIVFTNPFCIRRHPRWLHAGFTLASRWLHAASAASVKHPQPDVISKWFWIELPAAPGQARARESLILSSSALMRLPRCPKIVLAWLGIQDAMRAWFVL
jgi:hypothetical protein